MSVLGRIGSFFSLKDEDDDELEHDELEQQGRNVVPLSNAQRRAPMEVAVFAPRSFADVTEIADALRGRRVVIVNLQGADRALLQRVVDFTSGVAYTIDGKIQKLADAIYLVVPAGINVNSEGLREQLEGDALIDLRTRNGANFGTFGGKP